MVQFFLEHIVMPQNYLAFGGKVKAKINERIDNFMPGVKAILVQIVGLNALIHQK